MAVSLGFHIVFAALGIGLPLLLVFTEFLAIRRDDAVWMALTRRWAKALGILVAIGAVSGTVLSFALGLFWPGLMGRWGAVIGLPFALEAFAFFIEAIFIGIYLYGWDRLIAVGALVVRLARRARGSGERMVRGDRELVDAITGRVRALGDGKVVDVQPIQAMLNPSTPVMTTHMILAGYMATGLTVASIYAVGMLKGRRDALSPARARGGAHVRAGARAGAGLRRRPGREARGRATADEARGDGGALGHARRDAPLTIGGIPLPGREETILGIRIPGGLSWLAFGDTRTRS